MCMSGACDPIGRRIFAQQPLLLQLLPERGRYRLLKELHGLRHATRAAEPRYHARYHRMREWKLQSRRRERHAMRVTHRFDATNTLDDTVGRGRIVVVQSAGTTRARGENA